MKGFGALFIVFSIIIYCVKYIRDQRFAQRELDGLAHLLEDMGAELGQKLTPLPELIINMRERANGSSAVFLDKLSDGLPRLGEESFSTIWSRSVADSFSMLTDIEMRAVEQLGTSLGRFDIEAQIRAIGACTLLLRERMAALRREQRDKRRVHMGIACAVGVMLVIVLI